MIIYFQNSIIKLREFSTYLEELSELDEMGLFLCTTRLKKSPDSEGDFLYRGSLFKKL